VGEVHRSGSSRGVERDPQSFAGSVQARVDGPFGEVEHPGDFRHGEFVKISKYEHDAMPFIQFV
jgi:hypothetical protein